MRIAYLDCASGISGDMMLGALVDAGVKLATLQAGIDSLGLPSCRLVAAEVKKSGFRATQITVEHEPEHAHRHLSHITAILDRSTLSPRQRDLATRLFRKIAEAEAKVHGTTVEKVHFHEVGAVDSIVDIVGTAIGWDLLGVERAECSPVPTGRGFVEIAHGRCAIPCPGTAELLRGVPLAESSVDGELTTPTGAAIVATLADTFGPLPAMVIDRIGYGAGQRDYAHANLLRIIVGEAASDGTPTETRPHTESIVLLETNLDNATGETIGHCADLLREAGALDVSIVPIQMKKGRPGVLLSVQCRPADADAFQAILFQATGTLGVRRSVLQRTTLARRPHEVETSWGAVQGKIAYLPDGSARFAPEYEACHKIAARNGVSLADVMEAARAAYKVT
jgi:uncharacterized protein (TIGR00299 family) protein